MNKIAIIGAGRYGEAVAQFLAERQLCREIALIDIRGDAAAGAALDINEAGPIFGYDTRVIGGQAPSLMEDAELTIVCAGLPRKPGMSRSDLLEANINVADTVIDMVELHAPGTKLLFVTNPVDIVTFYAWKRLGWDTSRIFGQAGVLDSARMAFFIAEKTKISVKDIRTMVLGGHGDTMVPLLDYTQVAGQSVHYFLTKPELDDIVERTRNGGAEVLNLRQTSSAYLAPAAAVIEMVDAIVNDRNSIIPTVMPLLGTYGHEGLAIGVPTILNRNGAERIHVLPLSVTEGAMFDHSVSLVKKDVELLKEIRPNVFK